MTAQDRPSLRVILLQGPVGPFFGRLQDALDDAGCQTIRILLNAGDRAFRGNGHDVSFTEDPANWGAWFASQVRNFKPDAILMFGDQRGFHVEAKRVAEAYDVAVICFEEGYLRPEFITMELGGNNANSPLRNALISPPEGREYDVEKMRSNGFRETAFMAARYFVSLRLGLLAYPHYQHHRRRPIIREVLLWSRNAYRKALHSKANLLKIQTLVDLHDNAYFVVALQVHDDLQLTCHGEGWSLQRLIENSIATFARVADKTHHLVFKGHPLDRGHSSSREYVERVARTYAISDRVHYVDDGSLGLLTRHCRGMVTINSTSALLAFHYNKPVFAFGASLYEQLTANGADRSPDALERFWRAQPRLNAEGWAAFRELMIETSLVNGSYYLAEQMEPTVQRVIARLHELVEKHQQAKTSEQSDNVIRFLPYAAAANLSN